MVIVVVVVVAAVVVVVDVAVAAVFGVVTVAVVIVFVVIFVFARGRSSVQIPAAGETNKGKGETNDPTTAHRTVKLWFVHFFSVQLHTLTMKTRTIAWSPWTRQAVSCVKALRGASVAHIMGKKYNDFLSEVKSKYQRSDYSDVWEMVRRMLSRRACYRQAEAPT